MNFMGDIKQCISARRSIQAEKNEDIKLKPWSLIFMVHRFFLCFFFYHWEKLMTIKSIKQWLYHYSRFNTNKICSVPVKLTKFQISIPLPRTCKLKKKSNLVANILKQWTRWLINRSFMLGRHTNIYMKHRRLTSF